MRYFVHDFQKWKTNKKGDEIAATLEKLLFRREIDTEFTSPGEIENSINRYLARMNEKYPRTKPLKTRIHREGVRLWIDVVPVNDSGRAFGVDTVCCAQAVKMGDFLFHYDLRTVGAEAKPCGEAQGTGATN